MMKFLALTLLLVFCSCSSDEKKGKSEAENLYHEAEELMKAERYILATEKLNQIKTQHPYSFYATPAELLQADVLFKQDNFVEAAAAYLLFRDFHPKHEKIPYVIYKIAESYYKQIPDTIDRDLEPAIEAVKYYDEVIQKYPDSSYAKDAHNRIEKCRRMLRQKDEYIANFYFKTKEWSAARYWYLDILENHKDPKTRALAMVRTVEASRNLKEWDTCKDYSEKFLPEVEKEDKRAIKSALDNCENKKTF
jgi:outer membrane protein assembly factor BamD